jgi:aerobic-type carbon monoxide dehydrogenase small subunit (CoxS/CutS family)
MDMLWICYKYFRDFVGSTALTHYSLLQNNFELHLLTSKFCASSAQFCLFCFCGFELHLSKFKFRSAQFHDSVVGLNFTSSVLFV